MVSKQSSQTEPERERRILDKIIVDCYGEEEERMGWWQYLEDSLDFPFTAKCIEQRSISPLKKGEFVEVLNMGALEDSEGGVFVLTQWNGRKLGILLGQLEATKATAKTKQAVEDWRYWSHGQ